MSIVDFSLPILYTQAQLIQNPQSAIYNRRGGPGWIRTSEGLRQRSYSPPHLATLEPTHVSLEPTVGLEPTTDGLQNRCSAN